MKEEIRCMHPKIYASYVKTFLGEQFVPKVFDGVVGNEEYQTITKKGMEPLSLEFLMDEDNWISNEASLKMFRNLSGLGVDAYTLGVYAGKTSPFYAWTKILGIQGSLNKIPDINAKLNKTKDILVEPVSNTSAEVSLVYKPKVEVIKEVCDYNRGWYTGLGEDFYNLEIGEDSCVTEGHSHCKFNIMWEERPVLERAVRWMQERIYGWALPNIKKENLERVGLSEKIVTDLNRELEQKDELRAEAVALFQDRLEKERLEKRLQTANLARYINHELRNRDNIISTTIDVLLKDSLDAEEQREYLQGIKDKIDKSKGWFERLTSYSESSKLNKEEGDLIGVLEKTSQEYGKMKGGVKVKLSAEGSRSFSFDKEKVQMALNNIVQNAVQACGDRGVVDIGVRYEDKAVYVTVEDDGEGMDLETQKQLFNEFFTTKEKGTGLGMALTKTIIEEHDGEIECVSEKGKGTKFTIKMGV